eukprot:111484_1
MLTLLFTILLPFAQSGKGQQQQGGQAGGQAGPPQGNVDIVVAVDRRLLQAAVPLPTTTEATGNGVGNAGGSGATEMECILSNQDPAGCAGRTTNMVNPPQNFK